LQVATAVPVVWFLSFVEHDATREGITSRALRALAPLSFLLPHAATHFALLSRTAHYVTMQWSAPQSPWRIVLAITGNPALSRRRDRNPTTPLDG
jgi:hypothetical protein